MGINNRWRYQPFTGVTNQILIEDEEHTIEYHAEPNAYGFYANEGVLLESPSSAVLVQDNTAQTAFTEQPRTIAPNALQFRIDYDAVDYYNTGFVQCNAADNGKAVLFTYYGTGTIVHPTFRLQTDFNYPGNVNVEGALGVTGAATVGAALGVTGAATVGGALAVDGLTTLNADGSTGDALSVRGNMTVLGDVILADTTLSTISASNKQINDMANGSAANDAVNFSQLTGHAPFENVVTITSTQSWTPPVTRVFVEVGGGGGGGGGGYSLGGESTGGGGGGSGATASALVVLPNLSAVTVTIGAGGAGGSTGGNGTTGGASSFGAYITANGGGAGLVGTPGGSNEGGYGGTGGSSDQTVYLTADGGPGQYSGLGTTTAPGGNGGNGGRGGVQTAGGDAGGKCGGGGGGGAWQPGNGHAAGGAGGGGYVRIYY